MWQEYKALGFPPRDVLCQGERTGNCESLWNIVPVGEKFCDSFQAVSLSGKPRDSAGNLLTS